MGTAGLTVGCCAHKRYGLKRRVVTIARDEYAPRNMIRSLWLPLTFLVACASAPLPKPTVPPSAQAAKAPDLSLNVAPPEPNVERVFALAPSALAPKRGAAAAKVTALVCSDFQCPFCAQLKPTLDELEQDYGELLHIEWRNCPLPFHEHALPAAEAAMEVFAQAGDKGFWAYHDVLFAHQGALEANKLVEYARGIEGVDSAKVAAALDDHRHVERVANDLRQISESGAASGGFGTPAMFINGRMIAGAQPYEVFEDAVERALRETPEAHAEAEAQSKAAYPSARVRHILIQWKAARGAEAKVTRTQAEAHALAQKLHDDIVVRHADMAALAKLHSDCPSAPDGGELGRFTRGELVPQFESAMFSLAAGQVSGVVETPFGYHVILREE